MAISRNFRFSCPSIIVLILMCTISLHIPNRIVVAAIAPAGTPRWAKSLPLWAIIATSVTDEGVNNGSTLQAKLFPLRDDKDYESLTNDDDDDDEYDDDEYAQNYGDEKGEDLNNNSPDESDDDENDDHEDEEHIRHQIHGNIGVSSDSDDLDTSGYDQRSTRKQVTSKPYSATSTTFCPEKCSCLGDFIECKNLNLQLPQIPNSVQEL